MPVKVSSLSGEFSFLEKKVEKILISALSLLKKNSFFCEVFLIPDKKMTGLNRVFRGKFRPTAVLSFQEPAEIPHPELKRTIKGHLGEIYLAPSWIQRNKENLGYLAVHGLLHLLGYTHSRKSDKIKMEKIEKRICHLLSPALTSVRQNLKV